MSMPFGKARAGADLAPEVRAIVAALLESHGCRELATAHLLGAGVRHAPTIDAKALMAEEAREEIGHFEAAAGLYAEIGGGDLIDAVAAAAAELPIPASWLEVAVAQFLFDRGAKLQLRELLASSYAPYAEIVERILREEEGHDRAAEATLRELCAGGAAATREAAQAHFDRWLPLSVASLRRTGADEDRRAVELGLKARDDAELVRDYLEDLAPAMAACGLRLPPAFAAPADGP